MKIIKVEGFKGLITMAFIGVCLFAGFVIFPGIVAMTIWNKCLAVAFNFPVINVFQGILLWGISVVVYCILFNNGFAVSFKSSPHELSEAELNMIMQNAKVYSNIRRIKDFVKPNDVSYIKNDEEKSENKDEKISNN